MKLKPNEYSHGAVTWDGKVELFVDGKRYGAVDIGLPPGMAGDPARCELRFGCLHRLRGYTRIKVGYFRGAVEVSDGTDNIIVRIKNLTMINEPAADTSRITLHRCDDVVLQNVTITGLRDGVGAVDNRNSTNVTIKALSLNGNAAPTADTPR